MNFHLTIPAYCESSRLPHFLGQLLPALAGCGHAVSVEVVDDGSPDIRELQDALSPLREKWPALAAIRCLTENRGKGAAIRTSWDAATGADYVGFVDADGSISAEEVVRLIQVAASTPEPRALFASRIRMLGRKVERHWQRHYTGRIYASFVGLWINPEVYDSQCGYKWVPIPAWRKISAWMREDGFAFDVELIAALAVSGLPMVEEAIDWIDKAGSKVSFFRDSTRMFTALWRIRSRRQEWLRQHLFRYTPAGTAR